MTIFSAVLADFFVRGLIPVAHRHQDAPLGRLEPIAYIWQCPADNDRHCIVEVTLLELFLDVQWLRRQRAGAEAKQHYPRSVDPSSQAGSRDPNHRYCPYVRHRHAARIGTLYCNRNSMCLQ